MLRSLLLASAFSLSAPALAQEVQDDMAPPTTEGMTAPDAQDQTAPNLPPGTVPTGMDAGTPDQSLGDEGMDHDTMDHGTMDHGSTSVTTDVSTEAAATGATGTMTTASTGEATAGTDADVDAVPPAAPTSPSGTYSGMGGPLDVQGQWASFDTVADGLLTPLEFARWVSSSMGQPMGAIEDEAVALLNQSADELAMVDTNDDWHVSPDELSSAAPQ